MLQTASDGGEEDRANESGRGAHHMSSMGIFCTGNTEHDVLNKINKETMFLECVNQNSFTYYHVLSVSGETYAGVDSCIGGQLESVLNERKNVVATCHRARFIATRAFNHKPCRAAGRPGRDRRNGRNIGEVDSTSWPDELDAQESTRSRCNPSPGGSSSSSFLVSRGLVEMKPGSAFGVRGITIASDAVLYPSQPP